MQRHLLAVYDWLFLGSPRLAVALLAALLAAAAWGLRDFTLDASADALLLENDADLRAYREVSARYGTRDFLFVAVAPADGLLADTTLTRIRSLRDELAEVPGVDNVISLLDVPLARAVPGTLAQLADNVRRLGDADVDPRRAYEELTQSPIYQDLVASADGTVTAIQLFLARHPDYERLRARRDALNLARRAGRASAVELAELAAVLPAYAAAKRTADAEVHTTLAAIRAVLARHRDGLELHLGGLSMIADDMLAYIARDLVTFGAGVLLFLVVMLALIFREPRWVLLPLASCVAAGLAMLGLLGHLGWQVTVISSNFVSLMLIITMSMNIHLVVRYRELFRDRPQASQIELVRDTVRQMFRPCFFTAFTTVIAFTSLVVSGIKPVIDFGWMMSLGLVVLFVVTFTLFPALLMLTPRRALARREADSYAFTGVLGRWTERHGGLVLLSSAVLGVAGLAGMTRLEVENSFVSYFHEDTEIYRGLKLIDEKLGGTTPLDIVIRFPAPPPPDAADAEMAAMFGEIEGAAEDAWFTPEKVDRIKAVHDYLERSPAIGKVLSLASGLRVAESMNGGEFSPFELNLIHKRIPPEVRRTIIDPYVSIADDEARITARIHDSLPELRRAELVMQIEHDLEHELGLRPDEFQVTGLMVLYNNLLQSLFRSQILSLGLVMLAIMLTLTWLFRSFMVALIGIIPNILAATSILGFMGWAGIPLDIMTITIAAITVGIAVDDCIHYLYSYRAELPRLRDPLATLHYCHANIAKAAFYTTLTITIGFSILVLSRFIPTILFGILTAVAMVVALLAALTLMPKLILAWRPFGTAPPDPDLAFTRDTRPPSQTV